MKRGMWVGLAVVVVLGVGGWVGYRALAGRAASASSTSSLQTGTVERGTLVTSVSAAGTIAAPQAAVLAWRTTGTVGAVNIQMGQVVTAGTVLMTLDPRSLDPTMLKAQSDLISAQSELAARQAASARAAQWSAAELAVVTAQQTVSATERSLRSALNPVSQSLYDAVRDAKLALDTASTNDQLARVSQDVQDYNGNVWIVDWYWKRYQDAQAKLDANSGSLELQAARDKAWSDYQAQADKQAQRQLRFTNAQATSDNALGKAQTAYAQAVATLNYAQLGPNAATVAKLQAQLAQQQAALAQAQDELARLAASADPTNVAGAAALVAAAQATVDQARLVAPIGGTVVALENQVGDVILQSGQTAVTIADLRQLQIQVDVSEVDINRIAVGQAVEITVDAADGRTFAGQVAQVFITGKSTQGVVTFPVLIVIPNPDPALKPGMTAAVSIVAEQHANVLLVPNRAVRSAGGQRTVTVLFEGQQISVPVTVGLSNETSTEVASDQLKEGDTVVITTASSTASSSSSQGGFIGAGGPPDGGGFPLP